MPARQPKRGRLWLNDGSCLRLRPDRPNHVWAYDFVEDRTREGRKFRTLNVVDEFSRECLAIRVGRRLGSTEVIDVLTDLFINRGIPAYIRSDNGPEFVATAVKAWITELGARLRDLNVGLRPRTASSALRSIERKWHFGYWSPEKRSPGSMSLATLFPLVAPCGSCVVSA